MATPGERFKNWVEGVFTTKPPPPPDKPTEPTQSFSDRIGLWVGRFIGKGIEGFMDILGKSASAKLQPLIAQMEATGKIPAEIQPLIDELKTPTGEFGAVLASIAGNSALRGPLDRIISASLNPLGYFIAHTFVNEIPGGDVLIELYKRDVITEEDFYLLMSYHGLSKVVADQMLILAKPLFPSEVVGPLWLRNKELYGRYWGDVEKLGLDEGKITALKELAYRVPNAQDVIRYMVKEAYSPDVYKTFRQDEEFPGGAIEFTANPLIDAEATGVRKEHLFKEWIAHWSLPSSQQGFDLLHRGKVTDDELNKLLKALDIMPFWRDKLIELSWDLPNRVELRMMARYGLVDKPFLMTALKNVGLREDYRETVADMMLAQGLMTDLPVRYRNKWITSDELKVELATAGLSKDIQERMYKWIVKNVGPERTTVERDLTAAEIIKGVKKGYLTWDDAKQQLMALGYDEVEANYKLAIDVEVVETVPTTELNTRVDSIRRRRRQRFISRDEEIASFVDLGIDVGLGTAYADNDDLRLVKVAAAKPPEVKLEYQTDDGKVKVATIRLSRRQRRISRDEEIVELMDLEMSTELAIAYADEDDLRLAAVKPPVPVVVVLLYQTELGKVNVDTFRRARRDRLITRDEELVLLTDLDVPTDLAIAYADNDELRLTPVKVEVPPKVIPYYQTEAGKVEVDTIRRKRQQRQLYEALTSAQIAQGVEPRLLTGDEAHNEETRLLQRLDMPDELATAYADNDDMRLIKEATGGA